MRFIKELWMGDKSLTFTFWVMGVLVPIILQIIRISLDKDELIDKCDGLCLSFAVGTIFYPAFIAICIWRSAGKYITAAKKDTKKIMILAYIARFYALSYLLFSAVIIIILGIYISKELLSL